MPFSRGHPISEDGNSEGFPEINNALFGLVLYNDHCLRWHNFWIPKSPSPQKESGSSTRITWDEVRNGNHGRSFGKSAIQNGQGLGPLEGFKAPARQKGCVYFFGWEKYCKVTIKVVIYFVGGAGNLFFHDPCVTLQVSDCFQGVQMVDCKFPTPKCHETTCKVSRTHN